MKDLYSKIGLVQALASVVVTDTVTGDPIDLQGFNSAVVLINSGAIAGSGNFTTKLQHSPTTTGGDFEDVAAADLIGSFPTSLAAASAYKVGYKGPRRYIRVVTTKNSGTSVAASITVLRGHPADAPVA